MAYAHIDTHTQTRWPFQMKISADWEMCEVRYSVTICVDICRSNGGGCATLTGRIRTLIKPLEAMAVKIQGRQKGQQPLWANKTKGISLVMKGENVWQVWWFFFILANTISSTLTLVSGPLIMHSSSPTPTNRNTKVCSSSWPSSSSSTTIKINFFPRRSSFFILGQKNRPILVLPSNTNTPVGVSPSLYSLPSFPV